jgi:hypothetical protein
VALLTSTVGKADADGEGLAMAVEFELLPGSVIQPAAASVARAMISPSVVCLIVFILEYLVIDVYRHDCPLTQAVLTFRYLVPGVLALGEADAAGEGLAAGLGAFTGVLTVAGDVDGEGLAVFGVFESLTGSVAQPAANTIDNIVRSRSAVRLIMVVFGVLIFLPRSSKIEKRDDDCSTADCEQWVFPQTFRGDLRSVCTETLVFKKRACTISERAASGGKPSFLTSSLST